MFAEEEMKEYEPKLLSKQATTFFKESSKKSIKFQQPAYALNSSKTFIMKKSIVEFAEENVEESPMAKNEDIQEDEAEE